MIVLELATGGACFVGVNPQAFLIHVLTHGVALPDSLEPSIQLLLKGLLVRDHRKRWQWDSVRAWHAGEPVELPNEPEVKVEAAGKSMIMLAGRPHTKASSYALAAAEPENWEEAKTQVERAALVQWSEDSGFSDTVQSALRRLAHTEGLTTDIRLSLALKVLYPPMPLVVKGKLVTPGWLLDNPSEGSDLIFGPASDFLNRMGLEEWLQKLKFRGQSVREKAKQFSIKLIEEDLQIHLLSNSRARLAMLWAEKRRLFPDTLHPGLNSLVERRQTTDEDFILLLSADIGQFRTIDEILEEAGNTAHRANVTAFDSDQARTLLMLSRRELHQQIDNRIFGFARSGNDRVDEWADQFRLDRRISLDQTLVLLSVPVDQWSEPPKQNYVATLLDYFSKKISGSILRGPLTRMVIGKTTPRVDLWELGTERRPAAALLDFILSRTERSADLDPAAFIGEDTLDRRLRSLHSHATLYKRDTGIDGLYMGFPFLIHGSDGKKPKIAPILLWPVKLTPEIGNRGHGSVAFDRDRDEVRVNPAFEGLIGIDAARRWLAAANDLLGRASLTAGEVIDGFGGFATLEGRTLVRLPGKDTSIEQGDDLIVCSAVIFHLAYMGQAIVEDLRQLKSKQLNGTALETALKLSNDVPDEPQNTTPNEIDRFFTVASDPSQENAVIEARNAPGLLIEGPPGTGKSQTIVNMIADSIGRKKSLLVVCQKQAALEVVKKRLESEGLEDRIFMVTDVNRDRGPVIQAVRDQLEAHRSNPVSDAWKRDRKSHAARIQVLESDLNGHHEAVHRIDDYIGLSYRGVIAELIRIETTSKVMDVPTLRKILVSLKPEIVDEIAETIGMQAKYWLPANYEGNHLHQLKAFTPDVANLAAFDADFFQFLRIEEERMGAIKKTPTALNVSNPTPLLGWFTDHDNEFSLLTDVERRNISRWFDDCQGTSDKSNAAKAAEQLNRVCNKIKQLSHRVPKADFFNCVAALQDQHLKAWSDVASSLNVHANFLSKLNPFRWFKINKIRSHLASKYLPDDIIEFQNAIKFEVLFRPLRFETKLILSKFGEGNVINGNENSNELLEIASHWRNAINNADMIVRNCMEFPFLVEMENVLRDGSFDAYNSLKLNVKQSLQRYEAKQFSRAALANVAQWFSEEWAAERLLSIENDTSNEKAIQAIRDARPTLEAFQRFRVRASSMADGTLNVFKELRSKETDLRSIAIDDLNDQTSRLIKREALLAWKSKLEAEEPRLLYEASDLELKIRAVAEAEKAMRKSNRQMLTQGIDASRIASMREWEAITRLRGQRAQRLREFMEKGADLGLMELRPVWLMNPDVASRVLPLRKKLFDTIIYDEASQMPVEYALPSLYRAEVVIISGDEKQMPPTAFFTSKVENDEADIFDGEELDDDATDFEREQFSETWNRREIKDCPDLLQLGKSVLPTTTLQIHYRSAYRELIGFSNSSFYANRLSVPVRHPEDEIRRAKPIEVVRVDGIYDSQSNHAEALKIVDLLAEIWGRPGDLPTIGVVSFNRKQADLVEEKLEDRAEHDEWFRAALARERDRFENGEDVGFFVKNVENVQGDERDFIIFSSTFGRNSQGSFRRNFGVLGQKGGERRLNVAVTRAKLKVIMVTSIPIPEVSDMLSSRKKPVLPRDYLQGYLEYARAMSDGDFKNGRSLLDRMVTERTSSRIRGEAELDGFASSVAEYLSELGLTPDRVNDGSAFGLDFALANPATSLYGLGIECDAPRHKILDTARAREVWRPSVLSRSIPLIHRVSCYGWYHNRAEEKQRLLTSLRQSIFKETST